ncbi:DNA alkylation repair protein [Paenibacillus sp. sptzw28]|uniref:DNA alkylation repair protein n=1 Tax=Paenibacillus sp. sptzw28 TaxID=715179 RepID=UPI001C6EAC5B|nr:DNA alkylation repair protein [Paenibacillus sp. sptzw28]QYR22012.1 DNA alkylation repair protein [Paenibacillus sp. sptzw28]
MNTTYAGRLEEWLRTHENAAAAEPMSAYMRNQFPFLGIKNPERAALTKQFIKGNGVPSGEELEEVALKLWALPEREFQYTAMQLLEKRLEEAAPSQAKLLEILITTKPWWDTVDLIAGHLVGSLFTRYPELVPAHAHRWIESDNLWLRRSALLFQLGYKGRTDRELLFSFIRRCAGEKDFFIRKAIGWALREYGKTDAEAVRQFVRETELSPLSVREALKRIGSEA